MTKRGAVSDRTRPTIDAARLDELALAYVARFATTKAKLTRYLARKLRESGWAGEAEQDSGAACAAVAARMEQLGFIDDREFAATRSAAMTRRGLGLRRVKAQLWIDGVSADDARGAVASAGVAALAAALGFARRRRLGPFAAQLVADPALRQRQVAAFARAGHSPALARRILALAPGDEGALDDAAALD